MRKELKAYTLEQIKEVYINDHIYWWIFSQQQLFINGKFVCSIAFLIHQKPIESLHKSAANKTSFDVIPY